MDVPLHQRRTLQTERLGIVISLDKEPAKGVLTEVQEKAFIDDMPIRPGTIRIFRYFICHKDAYSYTVYGRRSDIGKPVRIDFYLKAAEYDLLGYGEALENNIVIIARAMMRAEIELQNMGYVRVFSPAEANRVVKKRREGLEWPD